MNRRTSYSILYPAAAIISVIVLFIADFSTPVVVTGALLLALPALGGRLVPPVSSDRV